MTEREALIALNMIEKVGPIRVRELMAHFGEAAAILGAPTSKLTQVRGIGPDVAESIRRWEDKVDLIAELKRIQEYRCEVLISSDDAYPKYLREIYDPPIVLYVRGRLTTADHAGIAMVGSRTTTAYGIDTARRLGYQLANCGITVVSGGARGIDTSAHQGALAGKGRTVAVLGCGINIVYPSENAQLFEKIVDHGAVITQFPFNRKADKQTFPIRNRIVAGMTTGTIVVEANLASGALITANMAADAGRAVFAVPGRIDSPRSRGCHDLIRKGARLCEGLDDILDELGQLLPASADRAEEQSGPVVVNLSEQEQAIYDLLSDEEKHIDDIVHESGLTSPVVSVHLLKLEMKRVIRQLPGKRFARAAPG